MSSWVALNIEPDEAVEEEVDDTKEIQIEEALKLYQNALKLHSQGPQFHAQTAEAYDALLNSEIFKYPESISDYERIALQDSEAEPQPLDYAEATDAAEAIGETDINDSTSSTLLQTIYLSYKNHGQYLLDSLQSVRQSVSDSPDAAHDVAVKTTHRSRAAIASFAEALERDDTDLNLWRQSARLSSALHSYRLVRYCLESVLIDDENRLEVRTEQLGLEETIAEERLREALRTLDDRLAISQVPVKKPKKALIKFLKRQADPYPYLPALPENLQNAEPSKKPLALKAARHVIKPSSPTWAAIGKEILQMLVDEDDSSIKIGPGASVDIEMPANSMEEQEMTTGEDVQPADESQKPQNEEPTETQSTEKPDVIMSDTQQHARKSQEPEPAAEPTEYQASNEQPAGKQSTEPQDDQSAQQPEDSNQQETAAADEFDSKSANGYRKRSSASAANDENAENMRAKSRRTRARESNVDSSLQGDEVAFDQSKYYEDRLEIYVHADEWLFGTAGHFLSKIGVEELGTSNDLRKHMPLVSDTNEPVKSVEGVEYLLAQDLGSVINNWDDKKAKVLSEGDSFSNLHDIQSMSKSGLAIFLEHSKKSTRKSGTNEILSGGEDLPVFLKPINDGWTPLHEVAFGWLKGILMPGYGKYSVHDDAPNEGNWSAMESTYTSLQWPDSLKDTVLQILQREDEYVYNRMSQCVTDFDNQVLHQSSDSAVKYNLGHFSELEMIQAIFELHLDDYTHISNPNSEVDQATRLLQWNCLSRWSMLARNSLSHYVDHSPTAECQRILLRHLWASTFHSNMAPDVQREHILLCLQDLKHILDRLGNPVITLVNNAAMSELSSEAIDREISKLKSMDFFVKIFNPESEDPVDIIETIEPLLEPSSIEYSTNGDAEPNSHDPAHPASDIHEMGSFLDRGDATLRLFLWRRLQEAYKAIDYSPKVVSCYLRSIETIVKELWSSSYVEDSIEHRQPTLVRWLKSLDSILSKVVTHTLREQEKAYECIDMDHLRSSLSAVVRLLKLLHSFMLYEDSVRVGQVLAPGYRGSLTKSLEGFRERLREMEVRCWILQYTLFREAISQTKELFTTPNEDRIDYLRAVHYALGIRKMCRRSHKEFLKLMKSELYTIETKEDLDLEICQIFYDLHGYRLINHDIITDHGCPSEKIDRATAIMMIDFVMRQAMKVNIKDLSKSDLKTTIDKMQQAIGSHRSSTPLLYNKRILTAYLRSPINPAELFRAARGVEDLPLMPVTAESAIIAQKGWYFLLGYAALTRWRSHKRLAPAGTSELDDAIGYFRQDLENRSGRWETWYRLAQTYDSKLEEDITWSAEKINTNRTELATLQRNAIHCYAMALAMASRTAEPTPETRATLSELFTDFGTRMYSSTREPLSMGAFSLADFPRHYSNEESQQMYKGEPFKEMRLYSAWNFASHLLKRAIVDKPKNWMNHYMLAKCFWKMYSCDEKVRGNCKPVDLDDVLDSLLDAIDTLPQRKDSRSDPIFEPHYKLVSIIHKLVYKDILTPAEGSKTLLTTPWARKVNPPEDKAGWKPYILEVLRNLKHADKSNWHHRMAMRSAHINYDDQKDAPAGVIARNELSQQIFTKTMSIQVWRPEYERPGRHFVYTTRYVYFFVNLLDQLDDRAGLDQLLRRVRKKQGDFINHPKLWEDICLTYGRIIRRAGDIKEGHEEGIFKPISWDEFVANTARLENLSEFSPQSSTLLELLRDSIELKKLNNNLMKVSLLEDLIADLYSRLYELNLPQLMEQVSEENKEKMKVNHLLMATNNDGPADVSTPPASGPAAAATAPAATPTSEAPTAPPRGRTKGIARRDVQKRAETIVASKVGSRALNTKPAVTNQETEPSQSFNTAATSSTTVPAKEDKDLLTTSHEDGEGAEPGSKHQNLDNESELSEVDDDKLTRLDAERASRLKPSSPGAEPGSEVSISASFDHDAGGEGEGEGEGEAPVTGEAEAEVEAEKEGDEDLDEGEGEGEGEGDTLMADEGYEEAENAAVGDETELVEEEEDGEEGEGEGEGEGEEGDEEGGGEGEVDDEYEGEGEGEGETELLQETEGGEAEDEPEGGGEGEGEVENETEQQLEATGSGSTQEGDNMNIDERAPEPETMDT